MYKQRGYGRGRSPTKFSYTFEDVARLTGLSIAAARKHAQRGNFDPNSLSSVLEFVRDRLQVKPVLNETTDAMRLINKLKK